MTLFFFLFLFLLGVFLLWKSSDWSISSAIRFSEVFQVHGFIVGFLIFSMATNLPEIISAIVSSIEGAPELSSGDLVGSAFVNLSLQLGIASLIAKKLPIELSLRNHLIRNVVVVILILSILIFFAETSIYLGIMITLFYFIACIWLPKTAKPAQLNEEKSVHFHFFSPKIDVMIKLAGSLLLVVISGWLTVTSAIQMAKAWHVPLVYVGATFMAVGTSLPELALEIHSIKRREYGLALGDIFGSSMLNLSFILGPLFIFNPTFPLVLPKIIYPFFLPAIALILFRMCRTLHFSRWDGGILIALFVLYIVRIAYLGF